jgi:hypothetical protein
MKKIFLFFMSFFFMANSGWAQNTNALVDTRMAKIPVSSSGSTEAIASYINSNFKSESDKIRAVFYWTASNISYDVKNMLAVNFNETPQGKIVKTLKTKKGVCIHYAEVFNDIANKIGVESRVISGYTKQNGKVGSLSHAWCAAKIENKWYLFDPTWGSGSINNGKFFKKINDYYFKTAPNKIISSHIPFDYLWQFLNYPITNNEFYEGKIQMNKSKDFFDFESEIAKYNASSENDKLFDTAKRIEKNGIKNEMILKRLESTKKELTYLRQNTNVEKLNGIVTNYNQAVVLLNDFIYYRNKKFKPTLTDEEINNMIQSPKEKLIQCQEAIYSVGSVGNENSSHLASIRTSISTVLAQAEEHALFVKEYLSKSKSARKAMFTKVSWFGIPLN